MRKLNKNKKIILSVLIVAAAVFLCLFYNYYGFEVLGELGFQQTYNGSGEKLSVPASILYYVFAAFALGVVPYACLWLTALFTYFFIHRKEKPLARRSFMFSPSSEELEFGTSAATWISWTISFLMMLLCAFGVLTL